MAIPHFFKSPEFEADHKMQFYLLPSIGSESVKNKRTKMKFPNNSENEELETRDQTQNVVSHLENRVRFDQ